MAAPHVKCSKISVRCYLSYIHYFRLSCLLDPFDFVVLMLVEVGSFPFANVRKEYYNKYMLMMVLRKDRGGIQVQYMCNQRNLKTRLREVIAIA